MIKLFNKQREIEMIIEDAKSSKHGRFVQKLNLKNTDSKMKAVDKILLGHLLQHLLPSLFTIQQAWVQTA